MHAPKLSPDRRSSSPAAFANRRTGSPCPSSPYASSPCPSRARSTRGSVLSLLLAIVLGIVLFIAIFGYRFTSILGAHQEQRTAIEAAAIAGALSLSRIVITDPAFGYVGISDHAPKGTGIAADDKFGLPVRGINTILATIRLDMIIADRTADQTMRQLADHDYQLAMNTKDALTSTLTQCIHGTPQPDRDGALVDAYQDAFNAYTTNVIRLGGQSNQLVTSSFRLSLGCAIDAPTNVPIPKPESFGFVSAADHDKGFFKAYRNIPYGNKDFVFAAIHDTVMLVDQARFVANPPLPYFIPSIVKADADQRFVRDGQNTHVVHAAACAQCASSNDPRPAPGALVIGFPDGRIAEFGKAADIRTDAHLNQCQMTLASTMAGNDYPQGPISLNPPASWQVLGTHPSVSQMFSRVLYDWLKRAGPTLNIKSVLDMMSDQLATAQPPDEGFMNVYTFIRNGQYAGWIKKRALLVDRVYAPVSDQQVFGVSTNEFSVASTGYTFDALVIDEVYRPGRMLGGKHGGEPIVDARLSNPLVASGQANPSEAGFFNWPWDHKPRFCWKGRYGGSAYYFFKRKLIPALPQTGPSGGTNIPQPHQPQPAAPSVGDIRSTYLQDGLAGEISFHRVQSMVQYDIDKFGQTGYP